MRNPIHSHLSSNKEYLLVFFLTAICFLVYSYHLGEVPPYHADENFYVVTAKNMVESGDYITPVYHEKKRFAKPVLSYWLIGLSYKLFGMHLVSARLVSAAAGALSVWVAYFLARRLFGYRIAILSAFILSGFFLHFQIARWATTDMTLNLFTLLAFHFFVKGYLEESKRSRSYILFYLSMALGFMSKGPPALLIPGLTVLLFLTVRRDWKMFGQLQLVPGTLIVLAVNLPWFITMYALHGEEFKNHLLGAEIRDRLIHDTPFGFYYIGVFFRYYQPWALFFVSAVFVCTGFASFSPAASGANRTGSRLPGNIRSALAKLLEPDSMPLLFCFLWLALITVLFTLVRIEHSRYMLPASPAIAMIVAHFFVNLAQSESGFRRPLFQIPFWMTIFFYFAITAVLGIAVLVFDKSLRVPFEIMFLPLTIAVGASCLILLFIARKWILLVAALALFQLTILAPVTGSAIPFFNLHPMKKFAETIRETGNGSETIAVYRLGNHRPRLGILTGQTTLLFGQPEDLEKFLDTDRQVFVVMREVEWDNAFQHLPLVRLASDGIWIHTRIDKNFLDQLKMEGTRFDIADYKENVLLFSNRPRSTD